MVTRAALAAAGLALAITGAVSSPAVAAPAAGSTDQAYSGKRSEDIVRLQVLLDRAGHSPGVIDGFPGNNTRRAVAAYQRSRGLPATGEADADLLAKLGREFGTPIFGTYTITQEDAEGPFRSVPASMTGKAELDRVAFETPAEALAEKFHMARDFLVALNPGADFRKAGTQIRIVRPGSDSLDRDVQRIEVDKKANELRAFGANGELVATYPITVGSTVHPSPNTTLEVLAVAMDPTYHFDPAGRSWGPDRALTIAPGPNNPVGVVWIDLSRDGYGIHGTPEPSLIGKTNSHGCVRLTNWDATELAKSVGKGTQVIFL